MSVCEFTHVYAKYEYLYIFIYIRTYTFIFPILTSIARGSLIKIVGAFYIRHSNIYHSVMSKEHRDVLCNSDVYCSDCAACLGM